MGGSLRWLITITIHLTSARLVVRKSVDGTHFDHRMLEVRLLCLVQRCVYKLNYAGSGIKRGSYWPCFYKAHTRSVCVIRIAVDQYFNRYRASRGSLGDGWASCALMLTESATFIFYCTYNLRFSSTFGMYNSRHFQWRGVIPVWVGALLHLPRSMNIFYKTKFKVHSYIITRTLNLTSYTRKSDKKKQKDRKNI